MLYVIVIHVLVVIVCVSCFTRLSHDQFVHDAVIFKLALSVTEVVYGTPGLTGT